MRFIIGLACIALIACGDDDRPRQDGGVLSDGSTDARASDAPGSDGPMRDGGGLPDTGVVDSGSVDAGSGDSGSSDTGSSPAMVDLTFAGCGPDFSGDNVVVSNADSIAVSSTRGGALIGSLQLALQDERGAVTLGTQHRVDTGAVINLVVSTTWTNIAMDSGPVLSGEIPDPIGGTLRVDSYDQSAGVIDVTFNAVTLQNPSDGSICQVDGRVQTTGLSF